MNFQVNPKIKNITVSGDIGTGKTTLAKNLANILGWKHLHAGEFFRHWHQENHIPLDQSERIPEELDRKIDMGYQKKMQDEKNIIFESHLAGWLAKDFQDVFRILCVTDEKVKMDRASRRDGITIEEAKRHAKKRSESYSEKFARLYGVKNHLDPKLFDLVIDTTNLTPEQVLNHVLKSIKASK
ncbi:cytidylate kinase family protein [Candidatus Daviesbacteria bacterium]|nr:cytidylate kinase family protein [Candidatus Daviesbacteria bacterium]